MSPTCSFVSRTLINAFGEYFIFKFSDSGYANVATWLYPRSANLCFPNGMGTIRSIGIFNFSMNSANIVDNTFPIEISLRYLFACMAFFITPLYTTTDRNISKLTLSNLQEEHIPGFFRGFPQVSQTGGLMNTIWFIQIGQIEYPVVPQFTQLGGNSKSILFQINE